MLHEQLQTAEQTQEYSRNTCVCSGMNLEMTLPFSPVIAAGIIADEVSSVRGWIPRSSSTSRQGNNWNIDFSSWRWLEWIYTTMLFGSRSMKIQLKGRKAFLFRSMFCCLGWSTRDRDWTHDKISFQFPMLKRESPLLCVISQFSSDATEYTIFPGDYSGSESELGAFWSSPWAFGLADDRDGVEHSPRSEKVPSLSQRSFLLSLLRKSRLLYRTTRNNVLGIPSPVSVSGKKGPLLKK